MNFSNKHNLLMIICLGVCTLITLNSIFLSSANAYRPSNFRQTIYEITDCNDGIDNDGDGFIDFASDPECSGWEDETEDFIELPPEPPVDPEPPQENNPPIDQVVSSPIVDRAGVNRPRPVSKILKPEAEDSGGDVVENSLLAFLIESLGSYLGEESAIEFVQGRDNYSIYLLIALLILVVITVIRYILYRHAPVVDQQQ